MPPHPGALFISTRGCFRTISRSEQFNMTSERERTSPNPPNRILFVVLSGLIILGCLGAGYFAARTGMAEFSSEQTLLLGSMQSANRAARLAPASANAHFARAVALLYAEQDTEAIREYEAAVALRPHDYFLWLTLGVARDRIGDQEGARSALEESARLAPYYAQPRWQLGNVLLRAGRSDEAFAELRRAATSDPSLLPGLIDLAWGVSGGDPALVEQSIQPQSSQVHLALARYFVKRGRATDAVAQFRAAGVVPENEQSALLQQLISARRFKEAYEMWSTTAGSGKSGDASIVWDGSFEAVKSLDQPGFAWQSIREPQGIKVALDTHEAHGGRNSLRVNYNGSANVNVAAVSQLIIIDAGRHYRLKFWARTQNLISGGLPLVSVRDAAAEGGQALAQSTPFPKNSNGWQEWTVEFDTGKDTTAVEINLKRQPCAEEQCPIFGDLWLDDFDLERLPNK